MLFALAQLNPAAGALQQNAAGIRRFYEKARARGADLVIFPEMALTGTPLHDLLHYGDFLAEIDTVTGRKLAPLTASSAAALLVGTPFQREGRLCNGVLLMERGRITACYPKTVLEKRAPFEEERYFSPAAGPGRWEPRGKLALSIVPGESALSAGAAGLPPRPRSPERRLLINPAASPYSLGRRNPGAHPCGDR
ncbi:MAG: hypothetical protein GX881_00485 [Firmicutes bacterium]|nr:hypothetical protein [Bacillota bacterium]